MIKNNFFWIFFLVLNIISCDKNSVFNTYSTIENGKWESNTPVTFSFFIKDTLAKHNLFINLRNNNSYPFSNLFLITKMKFPDKHQIIDTLEYEMTDAFGKFLGSGFSEIKENKLVYKEHITFPVKGDYQLEIKQAMRKRNQVEALVLQGVTNVGFSIEKNKIKK